MLCVIACPPTRERVHYRTVETLSRLQIWLPTVGHSSALIVKPATKIVDGRNYIATQFVKSNAELLIGVDNDVSVEREAFERMLAVEADYVSAEVPQRIDGLEAFAEAVRGGMSNAEAQRAAAMGPGAAGDAPEIREVERVGAGFFMLRRGILETLVERKAVPRKLGVFTNTTVETFGFYDPIYLDDGTRLSEELSFCKRVREAGGSIRAYGGSGVVQTSEIGFSS